MTTLTPQTQLQRIPELDVHLNGDDSVQLKWKQNQLKANMHTLEVLSTFTQPTTFEAGLKQMLQAEEHDAAALSQTIRQLFDAGVLCEVEVAQTMMQNSTIDFNSPSIHIEMLNDRARTKRYINAIREVVRPGDIVVDLGTGTGVLAMAAAQAGASHVYAIEINKDIAEIAKANFALNGFADTITLCHGNSTDITLPEQADVLVSEIIGDDPLDEQIIELTADARKRFLKPDARMIPNRIELFGLLVTIPSAEYSKHKFSPEVVAQWKDWYNLDFSALVKMPHAKNAPLFNITTQLMIDWDRLHPPLALANIDLYQNRDQLIDHSETFNIQIDGLLNGLLVYFEVQLSPQIRLSSHPDKVSRNNHWRSPVWGVVPAIDLKIGDNLYIQYEADLKHNWTYAHVTRDS